MQLLRKYKILGIFIYLSIWASLSSTPLTELFRPPVLLSRIYSFLLYFPFFLVILWKLIQDVKKIRVNTVNVLYYVFAAYYCALCVYRFWNGMEVQESIYYSVVIFGSIALYCQIRDGSIKMDAQLYRTNFIGVLVYVICYKIVASLLSTSFYGSPRLLGNPPINNLYSTSMIVMLLPFMVANLCNGVRKKLQLESILLTLSLILILTCSSRAIFLLALFLFTGLIIIHIGHKRVLIKLGAIVCSTVCIIGVLAMLDFGTVRYSLYREIGLFGNYLSSDVTNPSDYPSDSTFPGNPNDMEIAFDQIERSDTMRSELVKMGLEQVKLNPFFGTGDLYYSYDLGYMKLDQTSHNFIIESLVCYGILGTLMIAVLFIAILVECKIICKPLLKLWRFKVSAAGTMVYYFAFGMVQPSVYNTLLCPLLFLLLAYFENTLSNTSSF